MAVSAPLEPRLSPLTRSDLDMSMSYLRSLSPIHIEYLRNMGVTGTLVASLVKDGELWGLISCHHYSPRRLRYQVRAACELLADVFSTRLAALDAQTVAQSVLLVPQLEEQIVETASLTGDWHQALFGALRALLLPLNASGAALIYEGQTLTTGLVPASEDLSRLAAWIAEESSGHVFQSAAIGKRESSFARLAAVASGVLALRLTPTRLDYMLWFRREQVQTVRWAGDPSKAVVGDDPNHLSPRRSFAVWTEQVRHSAQHWSAQEQALAQVLQSSIADTIQQVQGIRVLIAARQLASVTRMVERAGEPMALFNERDQVLLLNQPMRRLLALEGGEVESLEQLARHFTEPGTLVDAVRQLRRAPRPWTGELAILSRGAEIAMAVRADAVPSAEGGILGTMVVLTDLSERREAEAARRRLVHALETRPRGEETLSSPLGDNEFGKMMEAVLENAKLAVHSVGGPEAGAVHGTAFRSIEMLTRRAAALARQMLAFASQPPRKG
jgi:PAS domain-containing protein